MHSVDVNDPKTIEERRSIAGPCQVDLKYEIPTYVDEMDDAVSKAYAAKPTRLYLIGLNGHVVYAGGLGPFSLKPEELGETIKNIPQVYDLPGDSSPSSLQNVAMVKLRCFRTSSASH